MANQPNIHDLFAKKLYTEEAKRLLPAIKTATNDCVTFIEIIKAVETIATKEFGETVDKKNSLRLHISWLETNAAAPVNDAELKNQIAELHATENKQTAMTEVFKKAARSAAYNIKELSLDDMDFLLSDSDSKTLKEMKKSAIEVIEKRITSGQRHALPLALGIINQLIKIIKRSDNHQGGVINLMFTILGRYPKKFNKDLLRFAMEKPTDQKSFELSCRLLGYALRTIASGKCNADMKTTSTTAIIARLVDYIDNPPCIDRRDNSTILQEMEAKEYAAHKLLTGISSNPDAFDKKRVLAILESKSFVSNVRYMDDIIKKLQEEPAPLLRAGHRAVVVATALTST